MSRQLFRRIVAVAVIGASACLGVLAPSNVGAASVNDFRISDYRIEYQLGRDSSNRSTLLTKETITAEFPRTDQNHGIERAIPKTYDGHKTGVRMVSVIQPGGSNWNYEEVSDGDNLIVRIGDADSYLHGKQTFILTYEQRDVTRFFSSTGRDEFYWDTNGTEWDVPIDALTVSLSVDSELAARLTGDMSCYQGVYKTSDSCGLMRQSSSTFLVEAAGLRSGENITVALGFKPETFSAYEKTLAEKLAQVWIMSQAVTGLLALGVTIWICARYSRWQNRRDELGPIAPEYTPPADTSVATVASLVSNPTAVFAAQLLDFAVRNYIKIYQVSDKSLFRSAEYELEIIKDISDLKKEEQEILNDIFSSTSVGARLALKDLKYNDRIAKKTLDNKGKLDTLLEKQYGIRHVDPVRRAKFNTNGKWLLVLSIVLLSPLLLVASIFAFYFAYCMRPLTDKGLALYRYVEGLKMYIKVAEADRIAMLQSPDGAAKLGAVDPTDSRQLVHLYEAVLPYAVLFGQEKKWNKNIGTLYESTSSQPSWYGGSAPFNAVMFGSAMQGFSSAASYSSASSSTSGGSSGSGYSGGGGGGGGGGGW